MNLATALILIFLIVIVSLIIRSMIKDRKKGNICGGCNIDNCGSCGGCATPFEKKEQKS